MIDFTEFDFNKYVQAVEELKTLLTASNAIVSVEDDSWLGIDIIILVNYKLYSPLSVAIPSTFEGFPVRVIDPYVEVEQFSYVIDSLVSEEPGLWDDNSALTPLKSIVNFYLTAIKNYEKKHAVSFL